MVKATKKSVHIFYTTELILHTIFKNSSTHHLINIGLSKILISQLETLYENFELFNHDDFFHEPRPSESGSGANGSPINDKM